jgi:anaerobic selenocysteine-containing dehydrogenase
METRRTFCRVCHAACPLDVDVDRSANRVVGVRGVDDDPIFAGYTCIKGRQLAEQLSHPDRLRHPLLRSAAGFERIDAADLFDHLAARLRDIADEHGTRAIASYTGTGAFQSSTALAVARSWHRAIGSPSVYTSVTIDQPAKVVAPYRLGIWEAGYHGFAGADVAVAIGYNPMVSSYGPPGGVPGTNPVSTLRAARRTGLKLIVVDPRRTELAAGADVFVQIRPGEDATLLAGIIAVVLAEGLHDRDFCERWVGDLDELAGAVAPFTPDHVARRCGITTKEVYTVARLFGRARRGIATTGTGPNMAPHSTLTEHLALALNTICGRVNRAGDAIEAGIVPLAPGAPASAGDRPE